jgi:hypothetical protein
VGVHLAVSTSGSERQEEALERVRASEGGGQQVEMRDVVTDI